MRDLTRRGASLVFVSLLIALGGCADHHGSDVCDALPSSGSPVDLEAAVPAPTACGGTAVTLDATSATRARTVLPFVVEPGLTLDAAATARTDADFDALEPLVSSGEPGLGVTFPASIPNVIDDRFVLLVEPAVAAAMVDGTYDAWSCLNDHYGATFEVGEILSDDRDAEVTIRLGRTLYVTPILEAYVALPGIVRTVERSAPHTTDICVVPEGSTYHYVVQTHYGDCPSGCISSDWYYFRTDSPGVVADWEVARDGDPEPCWASLCDPMDPLGG